MFWMKEDQERMNRGHEIPIEYPDSDESGSEARFHSRIDTFRVGKKPVFKHHFWWLVHNAVAHPLIGFFPSTRTFDFHDWTSKKINGE